MLLAEALGLQTRVPLALWDMGGAAAVLGVALVFVIRDVLFLQWAGLTRMKRPVVKGFLYLWLYYVAAGIICIVTFAISTSKAGYVALGALTPFSAFGYSDAPDSVWPGVFVGLVLQLFFIVLLLRATEERLRRPALVPALSEG
jgi:hypothetical protein